jgi:hypothetical protein
LFSYLTGEVLAVFLEVRQGLRIWSGGADGVGGVGELMVDSNEFLLFPGEAVFGELDLGVLFVAGKEAISQIPAAALKTKNRVVEKTKR